MAYITKTRKKKQARTFNALTEHQKQKRKERQAVYQSQRWQRLRAFYLSEHPLCERCRERGITKEAIDVHHKITFVGKGEKTAKYAYDYGNLQALCKECHQAIHNIRKSPI
jgi:5-methylcytosine-specific restriction protein A